MIDDFNIKTFRKFMNDKPTPQSATPLDTVQENLQCSLHDLAHEASELFKLLDTTSDIIRKLETDLKDLKANFPFLYVIHKEPSSLPQTPEERHKKTSLDLVCYITKVIWYLSWDLDESSQKYRLLLISKETELLWYRNDYMDSDSEAEIEFQQRILSKKPFIETDLQTRLKYANKLPRFIDAFKNHLREYRVQLANSTHIPWIDDLPF